MCPSITTAPMAPPQLDLKTRRKSSLDQTLRQNMAAGWSQIMKTFMEMEILIAIHWFIYMYICVYIYMCVCVHWYIYIYRQINIRMWFNDLLNLLPAFPLSELCWRVAYPRASSKPLISKRCTRYTATRSPRLESADRSSMIICHGNLESKHHCYMMDIPFGNLT